MAFIDILPNSSISDEVRAMYARQEAHWGFVPNYAKVFCHRPEIMGLWAQLQIGIKRHMTKRRFEIVTFVSAIALRSTLCSLGHGRALTEFIPEADVLAGQPLDHGDADPVPAAGDHAFGRTRPNRGLLGQEPPAVAGHRGPALGDRDQPADFPNRAASRRGCCLGGAGAQPLTPPKSQGMAPFRHP